MRDERYEEIVQDYQAELDLIKRCYKRELVRARYMGSLWPLGSLAVIAVAAIADDSPMWVLASSVIVYFVVAGLFAWWDWRKVNKK